MMTIRRANTRGNTDLGWLKSQHTFSFADYHDERYMGFAHLRVLNDDWVAPGAGFATHPHRNMEIISFVLEGALEHKDSMGNGSIIRPGEIQRMSAGNGVTHSEYNHSKTDPVRFLQIWFPPIHKNSNPSYEQKAFAKHDTYNQFILIASQNGADNSISLDQDVNIYFAKLDQHAPTIFNVNADRKVWVQVIAGSVQLNNEKLHVGDAVIVERQSILYFECSEQADLLVFCMKSDN